MDLLKLFRTNRITALGSRLAATSSVCLFALLGASLLWFSELGSDTRMLLTLFVVVACTVVFALGRSSDAATKKDFAALKQALQQLAKGDPNAKAPEEGEELGVVGALVNTLGTELIKFQRLVEQRVLQLKTSKESENASQLKSLFLSNLSQELQVTFNHVISLCEMLSDTGLGEEQQCITSHIERACATLVDTLATLSDFEALGAGSLTIANEEFELHTAIKVPRFS